MDEELKRSALSHRDYYLRKFEDALAESGMGFYEMDGLLGEERIRRFQSAKEAVITAKLCGRIGAVALADKWLLEALAVEVEHD